MDTKRPRTTPIIEQESDGVQRGAGATMNDDPALDFLFIMGGAVALFVAVHTQEIEHAISVLKYWSLVGLAWFVAVVPFGLFAYLLFKGVRPLFERPQAKYLAHHID